MLLEEDIILLNKLRINNPEAYERKLRILGIKDDEVPRRSVFIADRAEQDDGFFTMGGKPYQGQRPPGFLPANEYSADQSDGSPEEEFPHRQSDDDVLYLVDGDNYVNAALTGIPGLVSRCDRVIVFATQKGLIEKLKKMTWYEVIQVEPGNQAVDNKIKSMLGNEVKRRKYKRIQILSHDKGFDGIIERYRKEFGLGDDELKRVEYY